jgi:hypothetical protein
LEEEVDCVEQHCEEEEPVTINMCEHMSGSCMLLCAWRFGLKGVVPCFPRHRACGVAPNSGARRLEGNFKGSCVVIGSLCLGRRVFSPSFVPSRAALIANHSLVVSVGKAGGGVC